ncbi:hypothetical protein Purlil1_13774 [Purpureocillium lilacinum]|uniref:Methyltransferase domain-containing protein n=1 Tax=Purpureocillium lilacinum TaxID=33203 RepID=A0ABR0BD82_PURLI|nr:hypothetical protein Purlil1_13774 [Purpureocillium lilacinum]
MPDVWRTSNARRRGRRHPEQGAQSINPPLSGRASPTPHSRKRKDSADASPVCATLDINEITLALTVGCEDVCAAERTTAGAEGPVGAFSGVTPATSREDDVPLSEAIQDQQGSTNPHQYSSWREPVICPSTFLADLRCVETLRIHAAGETVEPETCLHASEHCQRRDLEGLLYCSDSSPPTNVNTPRCGTPESHGSQTGDFESQPVQTSPGHRYGVDGGSSSTTRSNGNLGVCQDEQFFGHAERLELLDGDSEESTVQCCRVAGPKSDISDSLPDTAVPSDIGDDAASDSSKKKLSSGDSDSDSSRNGPAHQCSTECEPFSAELHCVEAWVRDVCTSKVEVSEMGVHAFEHQHGRRQEGGLPCTSEIVNLSSPPPYGRTPRVATPDTQGCETASGVSQLGILFRSIVDELYKLTDPAHNHGGESGGPNINSRTGGVLEQSQDEHILERAERMDLQEKSQEEPRILSPRVAELRLGTGILEELRDEHSPRRAKQTSCSERDQEDSRTEFARVVVAPKSNASDSLPDIAIPSDASDDTTSESLDVRPLHTNQTTVAAAVPLSDTEIPEPGDEVAAAVGPADDADSTFGKGPASSSASLSPSIMEHEWKYDRRYHSYQAGLYCFPNDGKEQNRLDMLHHAFLLALDDRLFLAPIGENPSRILDVGAGTGIWTMDVADEYPSAGVRGYDLSPIQPQYVPPNVEFFVDDVEEEWLESTKYDFEAGLNFKEFSISPTRKTEVFRRTVLWCS